MDSQSYLPIQPGVGMEENFLSIDDILLSHERLPVRTECVFPRLGFLEKSNDSQDIPEVSVSVLPEHLHWAIVNARVHILGEREVNVLYYCPINVIVNSFILVSVTDTLSVHLRSKQCQISVKNPLKHTVNRLECVVEKRPFWHLQPPLSRHRMHHQNWTQRRRQQLHVAWLNNTKLDLTKQLVCVV